VRVLYAYIEGSICSILRSDTCIYIRSPLRDHLGRTIGIKSGFHTASVIGSDSGA
jgi:hypothetical protein